MLTRFPWVGSGTLPAGYQVTGREEVKSSVRREPKPGPAAPAGIEALTAEIAANQARTAEIRAELVRVDADYERSALEWDVAQDVTARVNMNACADRRRALAHELNDLTDELPRLQARLKAARLALRAAQIEQDSTTLPAVAAEFEDLERGWRELAADLVQRFVDLVQLRDAYRSTVRRIEDACRETGQQPPAASLGALRLPLFDDAWLDGAPRSVDAARRGLGIQD